MRKLFWKAVGCAALVSLVAALILACDKPTVYSVEKIQYSDSHQCLGVVVHLDNDEVIAKGCSGFEIAGIDENGIVELFRSVDCDYYQNAPYEGMVVTCYSSNGLTWVREGEYSEIYFFWGMLLHWFIGIWADIVTVMVIVLLLICLAVEIILLRRRPDVFARIRTIKRYFTSAGTGTDLYYVDGISKETLLSRVDVVETSDELDFQFDLTFSDMIPVDKVLNLSKDEEEKPTEGQVVTVFRKNDEWVFIAGEFSLRKAIKRKRCSLYKELALNVFMLAVLLFFLFI